MKIIIFAGGTGKRFWPASRIKSPKQFIPIIDNKPLVKVKFDYIRKGFDIKDIFISTGIQYKKEIQKIFPNLPKENFIFEPEMKDSGPAVALAVSYVHNLFPHEVICTQWCDHYIKKVGPFINALKLAEEAVKNTGKTCVFGVTPRYPSPHWGYIKYSENGVDYKSVRGIKIYKFKRFIEKPTPTIAKRYLKEGGYLWNPGYFVFNPENLLSKYETFAPKIYETVRSIIKSNFNKKELRRFSDLRRIAFDYIFPENLKPSEALVINADIGWSDVGEWEMLKETLKKGKHSIVKLGNAIDLDSSDSLIYNLDNKKLLATIDLEGMIVVNTKDVTLIMPKKASYKLKKYLTRLNAAGYNKYL